MSGMTRRVLLRTALSAGVGLAAGAPLWLGGTGSSSTGVLLRSQRPLPTLYEVPLTVPPVLAPVGRTPSTDYYEILQRPGAAAIFPRVRTTIWGYNGVFPGPTIRARRGRRVVVRHRNHLPVPTVVHLHGGHTPPASDGYPTDLVLPASGWPTMTSMPGMAGMSERDRLAAPTRAERVYTFPTQQRAATLWYHDHRMDFTGASVWRGLAGFHLIGDDEEEELPLPTGDRDIPLMISDRAFDRSGQLLYPNLDPTMRTTPGVSAPYVGGVLGDTILVNGRPWPYAEVAGIRYRLRLLNASNARRYRLRLAPSGELVQIGSDGGLLASPVTHDAIEIAPAERFDVVVDFSHYTPGTHVDLVNDFGDGPTTKVMQFRVGEKVTDTSRVPDTLASIAPLDAPAATRTMFFQGTGTGWTINGQPYDPSQYAAVVRRGSTEIWRLITDMHHPVHLHLVHFQVLSRGLRGPGPYDAGWKDVIDLRPAEEASITMSFDGDPGRYVFHCHNLEHEDMGMMGNFRVV